MNTKQIAVIAIAAAAVVIIAAAALILSNGSDSEYVTFDGNGGVTEKNQKTVRTSANLVIPNPFVNGGKIFTGWNDEADGTGTTYTVTSRVAYGIVLYAQWADYGLEITNPSYPKMGFQPYITDETREMEKLNGLSTYLGSTGEASLSLMGLSSLTYEETETSRCFKGVNRAGQSVEFVFNVEGADEVTCSVEMNGKAAVIGFTYSGNVRIV